MPAASGQYADIKVGSCSLVECTEWTMDDSVADFPYSSCATSGHKKRVTGPRDSTGTLAGIFDPDDPIHGLIEPGDAVTLKLFTKSGKGHSVPAVIISLNHGAQIEEGSPLRWNATWGQNGAPTLNGSIS